MKFIFGLLIFKIISLILKLLGKNANVAGKVVLSIYPNILNDVELPEYVIAITGSNGKKSTATMINEVLTKSNYRVGFNGDNYNTLKDIATLILKDTTIDGKYHNDVILFEVDVENTNIIFSHITPTHVLINNIHRNQESKNGSYDYLLSRLKKAISPKNILVLNADDPLVSALDSNDLDSYYFGISNAIYAKKENDYIYDDGYYCPRCKSKLIYSYHQFAHIGKYRCSKCKFARQKPKYEATGIDLVDSTITINNKYEINLSFNSVCCAYNTLAAYSICSLIGVNRSDIVNALNNRTDNEYSVCFKLGLNRGEILTSNYENPVSYNQNIEYIIDQEENCRIILMIDDPSIICNTSWLWDINFELLADKHIKEIIVTGLCISDIIGRLSYANINMNKVYANKNIEEAIAYAKEGQSGYIYVLTSDKDKARFISKVDAQW